MFFKRRDRRQEPLSLQAVLVEFGRRAVRRCNQRDAAFKQGFEQSAENHGIADVTDEELVKTQHTGFAGDVVGHLVQRIFDVFQFRETFVYFVHDAMEVVATFRIDVERSEEQVHQHGFATTDTTPDIQALHGRYAVATEQATQQAGAPLVRGLEPVLDGGQLVDDGFLRRVVHVIVLAQLFRVRRSEIQVTIIPVLRPYRVA